MKAKKKTVKSKKEYPFKTVEPPKRHGHPWTSSEGDWVRQAWAEGHSVAQIAKICDRTSRAITCFLDGIDSGAFMTISVGGRHR